MLNPGGELKGSRDKSRFEHYLGIRTTVRDIGQRNRFQIKVKEPCRKAAAFQSCARYMPAEYAHYNRCVMLSRSVSAETKV